MTLPRWLAATLFALLLLAPGPLVLNLTFDNAPESYFPKEAPAVLFDASVREEFPEEQVLVGLFGGEEIYEPENLSALHELIQHLEENRQVERVLGVTSFDQIRAVDDGFTVEKIVPPGAIPERSGSQWQEHVRADRFAPGLLAARDSSALAIIVRPTELEDSLQRLELERAFREAVAEAGLDERLQAVAGHVALDVWQLRSMLRDSAVFIPATTAVGLGLLFWMFRRWLVVVAGGAAIGAVVSPALALMVLLGHPYTLVTSILPPLLAALTVAMLMHLFNALSHAHRRGYTEESALAYSLERVSRPALFTALTTAAGLLSLTLSPIRPIESLGYTAAFGVLLAYCVVMVLLPPLLARFDRGNWSLPRRGIGGLDAILKAARGFALRRAGWIVAVSALAIAATAPLITKIEVESDLYEFFPAGHPITQDTRKVEDALSGVMVVEAVFDAEAIDGLQDPAALQEIRDFQRWAEQREEVDYALSMVDMLEEMHWAFHDEDPEFRTLPGRQDLIAQYLFVYDGRDLYDLVNRDFTRAIVLMNLNVTGAREIGQTLEAFRGELDSSVEVLDWELSGMGRLFAEQEELLIEGQLRSLIAVAVMISVLMLVLWRSAAAASVTMLTNLSPLLVIFIVMGAFGVWLDMATAMVASVAIGIAVDDTIHTYHGFLFYRRRGSSVVAALARALQHTGRAVTATTIVLCAQFLVLAASDFQPTAAFGLLTAIGLVAALLFDLLLMPAIVTVLAKRFPRLSLGRVSA
ncbi:efflux RND transporter permease subunit [Halorhodospira halophila]|nr:MMPL family transporter [Halorhodospira halophila]MBK1729268.1 RND transporter [Halorhodospira halophila]